MGRKTIRLLLASNYYQKAALKYCFFNNTILSFNNTILLLLIECTLAVALQVRTKHNGETVIIRIITTYDIMS